MSEKLGLKNGARSPGSTTNIQHHDASGGQKNISASPSLIEQVIATPTSATPVSEDSVVRAYNNTGAVAYIWFGEQGDDPVTPGVTNAIPLAPNMYENFLVGRSSDDMKSMMVKAGAGVLVLEYKSVNR